MNRLLLLLALGLFTAANALAAERPEKPNIVLMYVDDLGWQDLKCYDIDEPSPYETPHIDALAKRGVLFWEAYSPAPTCSPSRGAVLAGKHPARLQRTHVKGGQPPKANHETRDRLINPWHMGRLAVEETTIAEVLKANGYRTGHSGKWHIAINHNAYPQPADHGFDVTSKGRGANSKMPPHRLTGFATDDPDDPYQLDADGFPKDSVTLDALRFMDEATRSAGSGQEAQPFFLYYATWLVHYPIQTRSRALLEKYCNKLGVEFPTDPDGWPLDGQRNPYYCAMVEMVDHYVGQLIRYLEKTDDPRWPGHKLIENTYLIFSSDNGGAEGGPQETYTDNAPLDEGKGSTREGGVRVPLIIAGPGVREGVETRVMANGIDFYPTILSWTKVDKPQGVQLEGCDLSAVLADDPADPGLVKNAAGEVRQAMIHHFPHGSNARSTIRSDGYKLIYNYDHVGEGAKPELELYRLCKEDGTRFDLEEANNLAAAMPDKAQAMKAQLVAALDEMNASRPYYNPRVSQELPNKGKVCRPLEVKRDGNTVSVSFEERGAKVVKGYLLYTKNRGDRNEEWFRQEAKLNGNGSLSANLPEGTTHYLFNLVDENNFLVSYPELDEQPAAQAAVKPKKNRAPKKVREPKKAAKPLRGNKQGTTVPEQRTQEWWLPRHKEKVAQAKAGNIDLVMIGDSITQAWEKQKKYAEIFAGYNTLNLGFGGDRTQNVLWRIQHGEIDGIAPKLVTLMIGTNNSRRDKPDHIFQGIKAILAELRGRLPEAKIVLFSIFPRKPGRENDTIMAVNARLPELADRKQVIHVDINQRFLDENGNQITGLYNRDLLHLSSKGYETWFKALQPLIEGNRPARGPPEAAVSVQENPVIRLWPIEQVGGEVNRLKEDRIEKRGRVSFRNIKDPNLTVYPVDSANPTPAVIYCPGGAYKLLGKQSEVIQWLNGLGITVFMLKYTVPDDREAAFRDVQRAMRLVRHQAAKWNIDLDRIGLLGQSAGGHLSARLSQNYQQVAYQPIDEADKESCEPKFVIVVSGAYFLGAADGPELTKEFHMKNPVAPTFLVYARDDKWCPGGVAYEKALREAGFSTHIELYEKGGHGLGGVNWFPTCEKWLKEQKFID